MFTGIVESTGIIRNIEAVEGNIHFTLSCPFTRKLKIDQSLAHDGCCLTVVDIKNDEYRVTAIRETLEKTALGNWKTGDRVNLERCMVLNERLDGHIVQGHIDGTGIVKKIENLGGSHKITISYDSNFVTVPQGSITVNGISLTVAESQDNCFSIAIIPYTWEHTNMKYLKVNQKVNLEFDIIGKYIARLMKK
ncbi:riboflavin synthase [Riemerella columbipharyngis]|uniref:Riboflavin synthase n=1 Tax=Riemerella columbipharyngis TaxID=1071918 RepID=A0A1G7EMP3_9FLAO|nr:riboflavin synthase [Riemerella columbipharyngis]SDE64958.1 riboflavin synthase [Riemerella columbipharyngis]